MEMKYILYYTMEGTVSTKPSIWAESDYMTLVDNQKTLAEKFQTMDGFTVEVCEEPYKEPGGLKSNCERKCHLKVAHNGWYFINNQVQLMEY